MKYIVMSHRTAGVLQEIPIIFPSSLVHEIVAAKMAEVLIDHGYQVIKCTRAGDCMVSDCVTGGKSSTLDLEGEKEDHTLIELHDVLHGIVF
jgi:hypothetical protein